MLTFLHPWLAVLAPLPWLLGRLLPPGREGPGVLRVPFGRRLDEAISEAPLPVRLARRPFARLAPWIVWFLVLGALARPQWIDPPIEKRVPTRDLLLVVDLSSSMDQKDFKNAAGETTDRLAAVKEIVGEFLEKREGDRVGLVVFGDAPFLQAPFSTDLSLSRRLLDETAVGMAGPRTAFGDAIGLGINLFDSSEAPAKTIIALTDGNDTKSQVPPVEGARVAADREIRVHTIAIGDPTTAGEDKLDRATLDEVARATGGRSFFAGDRDELAGIYDELDRLETREIKTLSYRPRRDVFHYPLGGALVISILAKCRFRRPRVAAVQGGRPLRVHPVTGKLELAS